MTHHVTAIFSDEKAAERAVQELIDGHFNADDISILVTDQKGTHREEVEYDTGVAEGATSGSILGGILGALGASLVATGVIAAPGFTIFATGPLLAAIRGAVAGAAAGLEIGGLAGLGFWKEEAHIHAKALREGGIVIGVPAAHEHAEDARRIFAHAGAEKILG